MHVYGSFGETLNGFRERLSGERQRQGWLAEKLFLNKSVLSKWVNGDFATSALTRDIILKIGRLYSLTVNEVDMLLAAAGADRPARIAEYAPLKLEECTAWKTIYGSERSTLSAWNEKIASAQRSYQQGELRSAQRMATEVLDELQVLVATGHIYDLWQKDDREELDQLWIRAWWELHMAAGALLETPQQLLAVSRPFRSRAVALAAGAHVGPVLKATAYNLEGDLHHMQDNFALSMDVNQHVQRLLGKIKQPSSLDAFTQRLIILDGLYTLSKEELYRQIRIGRDIAESLSTDNVHARVMLLDAIARTLARANDPDCWSILEQAEQEARDRTPVGFMSVRYSRLAAHVYVPRSLDADYLRSEGKETLLLAKTYGWQRRVRAIQGIVLEGGVTLG